MRFLGSHDALNFLGESLIGVCVGLCAYGYCSVYVVWLSMCFGSFRCRLMLMGGVLPSNLVRAACRVLMVCGLSMSARALSLAIRYILSFGLEMWGFCCGLGSMESRLSFGRKMYVGFGLGMGYVPSWVVS